MFTTSKVKYTIYDINDEVINNLDESLTKNFKSMCYFEERLKNSNINNFNKFFPENPLLRGYVDDPANYDPSTLPYENTDFSTLITHYQQYLMIMVDKIFYYAKSQADTPESFKLAIETLKLHNRVDMVSWAYYFNDLCYDLNEEY
jgi:hypothetical protein